MKWMGCVEGVGIGLKSIWRCTPTHEMESGDEKDSLCKTERRREWRESLEVSVMKGRMRVWNEVSRITEMG